MLSFVFVCDPSSTLMVIASARFRRERSKQFARRLPELVGQPELFLQLRRAQVFADVRQPLFERSAGLRRWVQCWRARYRATCCTGLRPAGWSRAARGRRWRRSPRGGRGSAPKVSSSSAASAVESICGRWLTQAQISSCRAGSRSMVRAPNFATHSRHSVSSAKELTPAGREEPHRVLEERRFGERRAAGLLARHGMAGQEARRAGLVVELRRQLGDLHLGAANVGDELVFAEQRREPLHPVEDGEHRPGQHESRRWLRRLYPRHRADARSRWRRCA